MSCTPPSSPIPIIVTSSLPLFKVANTTSVTSTLTLCNDKCTVPNSFVLMSSDFSSPAISSPDDLFWLKEDVEDEQAKESSPQRASIRSSLRFCKFPFKKKAVAATSAVKNEDGDKYCKGDLTEACEENLKLSICCSESEIQGPKKKGKKNSNPWESKATKEKMGGKIPIAPRIQSPARQHNG